MIIVFNQYHIYEIKIIHILQHLLKGHVKEIFIVGLISNNVGGMRTNIIMEDKTGNKQDYSRISMLIFLNPVCYIFQLTL